MLGGNPVYSSPGVLDFKDALAKVRLRAHLSEYVDETSFLCDWHIPAAHFLESWSDARAYDGTTTVQQPLIAPLYGGRTAHEVVAVLQGQATKTGHELVQAHWQKVLGDDFGRTWRKALHDGIVADSRAKSVEVAIEQPAGAVADEPNAQIEIEFRPDPAIGDGSYSNNAWLQECPKPLTKLTWDNVAHVSPATAQRLELTSGDVVKIGVGERSIHAPVWVMPGQADDCVSLTFGYGRTRSGRIGNGLGYNAYEIRPAQAAWFTTGEITKTGRRHSLSATQDHHSMEGRDIVRVTTLERFQEDPDHLNEGHHAADHLPSLLDEDDNRSDNAWGMVIDQTACIGCNSCVVACQAENNVPVVGKEQVALGREMHWLRIDRYYHGPQEDPLANPETYFQPMMCVHCEKAPCEVVCPVAATVHDSEGTSNMVYNRCVGTRYCSNNCPYKVRRFNFLQFTDETIESLKLLRNPDVTVRSRGVMEKCSYCIQRLNLARIDAKKGNRPVGEGDVQTACQQACPTQAIVFSNLNAKGARAAELKKSPLNYGVLAELNTQPRTTHLARVVNPHPDLPGPTAAAKHKRDTPPS
jgi:molybdopterin-containing oxidoreductase family iron-sulfur binding subunit